MVKKLQISIIFGKKTMQYQTVKKKTFSFTINVFTEVDQC